MRIMYLADEDENYIFRLADYIKSRGGPNVHAFSDAESLAEAVRRDGKAFEEPCFVLGEGILQKLADGEAGLQIGKRRVFCLTAEKGMEGGHNGISYIYKYKPASKIAESLEGSLKSGTKEPLREEALKQATVNGSVDTKINPAEEIKQITEEVRKELELVRGIDDEIVSRLIDEAVENHSKKRKAPLHNEEEIKKEIFNSIRRLDVLQSFIDDEEVTEIMVNGLHSIFIEKGGRLYDTGKAFSDKERLQDIIQQIAAGANRTVNTASPIVDARLASGARVNVVLDPVAINGPILTIRRFPKDPISVRQLIETGSVTEETLAFLKKLVEAKYNIIISGGTGSGKTTFLNILSGFIPKTERIITIEDSAELQIRGISNLVRLETRNANVEGVKPITIRDLIKASLRMRPDRVVVGEVRGEEAIDMLQAMNVGMDGSLSTIHANSAKDALSRLEAMMLMSTEVPIAAIRRQMASGIDIIIQLGRLRDKSRHLLEVIEVKGYDGNEIETQALFSFREEGEKDGRVEGRTIKENDLIKRDKLYRAGLSL